MVSVSRPSSSARGTSLAAKAAAAKAAAAKKTAAANAKPTVVNGVTVRADQAKWLAGDASYGQTQASLADQLASYQADRLNQRNQYAGDEADALSKLGFKGAVYTPGVATKTNGTPAPTIAGGAWDQHDESGAFGRDMVSNADAAAARGMAGSGAYFKQAGNIGQQYADQGSAILKAGVRQQNDYTNDLTNYQKANTQTSTQALYDALARRAATLQTVS